MRRSHEAPKDRGTFHLNSKARKGLTAVAFFGVFANFASSSQAGSSTISPDGPRVINCGADPKPIGCRGRFFDPGQPDLGMDINPALVTPDSPLTTEDARACQDLNLGAYKDPAGRSLAYRVIARGRKDGKTLVVRVGLADWQLNDGDLSDERVSMGPDHTKGLRFRASCDETVDASAKVKIVETSKGKSKVIATLGRVLRLPENRTGFRGTAYLNRQQHHNEDQDKKDGLKNSELYWKILRFKLKKQLTKNTRVVTTVTVYPKPASVSSASVPSTVLNTLRSKSYSLVHRIKLR